MNSKKWLLVLRRCHLKKWFLLLTVTQFLCLVGFGCYLALWYRPQRGAIVEEQRYLRKSNSNNPSVLDDDDDSKILLVVDDGAALHSLLATDVPLSKCQEMLAANDRHLRGTIVPSSLASLLTDSSTTNSPSSIYPQ